MNPVDISRPGRRSPTAVAELAVEYPSSDGKPMGETGRHAITTALTWLALDRHFTDREDVYVGMDMLLYYVEGNPRRLVVPDVFVVFGVPKLPPRDNWLVWREGKAPDFVLEVTSRHTRHRDEGPKRELYRRLGVAEYWQFDPTGDYLDPRLKGARLTRGGYRPIPARVGPGGIRYVSRRLEMELHLVQEALRFYDPARAEYLATPGRRRPEPTASPKERNGSPKERNGSSRERNRSSRERNGSRKKPRRPCVAWPNWKQHCGRHVDGRTGS